MEREIVVTLIHGTFARGAAWTERDAPWATALRDRFGGALLMQRFLWSGANSHKARRDAAWRLAKLVEETAAGYPKARHYVVAHSHGGNVALYGLRNLAYSKRGRFVSGVVCIGVPFLRCQAREIDGSIRLLSWVVPGLVFLCSIPILLMYLSNSPSPDYQGGWATLRFLLGRFLLLGLVLQVIPLTLRALIQRAPEWAGPWQTRLARELHAPAPDGVPLLVIHSRHDEAYDLLHTSGSLGELPFGLWQRWVVAMAFVLITVGISYAATGAFLAFGALLFSFVLTAALIVLVHVVAWVFHVTTRLPGFWWEGILEPLLVQVGVCRVPSGALATEIQVTPPGVGLKHSLLHDDPAILSQAVEWMSCRTR